MNLTIISFKTFFREKDTQTPKETGTNPTKHTRYIKGLRGNKDAKMTVVELKFDQN